MRDDSNVYNGYEEGDKKSKTPSSSKDDAVSAEDVKKGLITFFKGIGVALIFFFASYGGLSFFDTNYLLGAFLALMIAIVLVWALNKATGDKSSRLEAPILATFVIAFLFVVLTGYQKHGAPIKSSGESGKNYQSVTFVLPAGEQRATGKVLPVGKTYFVTVEGLSVKLLSSSGSITLEPNANRYRYVITKEGSPTFVGLDHGQGKPSIVTVEWQE
jgi:hypothetical protein